ncbi:hypothetical protein KA977_14535, partial [Candidatus Dependentiae bacterium]|nr:hypothetical protein [Candidatus Dependentiae bacterium]
LVPAHVQNDMHLPFTGPDDYEEYVRIPAVVGKIQGYGTSPKQESSLEEYHKRLAEKTYTASSFQADFNYLRLGRPSASGELKEMFGDKLKYVFSGSSGTSGKLYWRIAGVGNYYPILLSSYTSDWWECTDAGASSQWDNYYYLENIDQANPYKIRNDLFSTYGPSNPTIPNTIGGLCKIYMEKKNNGVSLIDVAINYSAGLLKYYHDAVNHPPYLKSAKIKGPGGKKYEGVWVDDEEERITPYSILANKYKKVMERFLNKSGGEKKKDKDPAKYTGWTDDGMMDDSKPLWCGTNFELILNFSEKVSKPTIEIELPAGASKNVSINVGASYQEIWTGEINFDEPDYLKKLSWESKWAYLEAALLFENLQRLVI